MICPKCQKDECIAQEDKSVMYYLCIGCGYRTTSEYTTKKFEFQPTIIKMDSAMKKMIWKDSKTGLYWFPIDFYIPKLGVLYPEGEVNNISWIYMPMMEMTDVEKRRNPGKTEKPDESGKKVFTEVNLKEALKLLKIIE